MEDFEDHLWYIIISKNMNMLCVLVVNCFCIVFHVASLFFMGKVGARRGRHRAQGPGVRRNTKKYKNAVLIIGSIIYIYKQ
jgi:hypothetical protein